MSDQRPLVSVVTATYNMAGFLPGATASVAGQSYDNVQHIIIDDGSTDSSKTAIEDSLADARVEYHWQENQGQTVAKNNGIKLARGEYVCFLDADNTWEPDKLERQVSAFADLPEEYGVVYTDQDCIDEKGRYLYTPEVRRHSGRITEELLYENFVTFNTAMVRRTCFESAGLMDESLARSIDYELWLRLSTEYLFQYLPGVTTHYRLWEGQMSEDKERRFRYTFRIINKFAEDNPHLVPPHLLRKVLAHTHASRGRYRAGRGEFRQAADDYIRALGGDPLSIYGWKSLFRMLLLRK